MVKSGVCWTRLIYAVFAVLFLTACGQDELEVVTDGEADAPTRYTLRLAAGMPEGQGPSTRAAVSGAGGFYWNEGDGLNVYFEKMMAFGGPTFEFKCGTEAEGRRSADFSCELTEDDMRWVPGLLEKNTYFYVSYPSTEMSSELQAKVGRASEETSEVTNYKERQEVRGIPEEVTQVGKSTSHLRSYLYMASGPVDIVGVEMDGNNLVMPSVTMHHKTALLRFMLSNKQQTPLQVSGVTIRALQPDGTDKSLFVNSMKINMVTLKMTQNSSRAFSTQSVRIVDETRDCYTLQPGEEMPVYCPLFPVDLETADLVFIVRTSDGTEYKTLAVHGSDIAGAAFEEGYCYTFQLDVDYNVTLQGWSEDWMGDVNLGQNAFSVDRDVVDIPLEGGNATLTVKTTQSTGWQVAQLPSWVSVASPSGPDGTTDLTFKVEAATAARSGEVVLVSGNLRKTVKVNQGPVSAGSDALYFTKADMEDENTTTYILTDDEDPSVYFDRSLRSFRTTSPLQVEVTAEQELHLRFYSPRKLSHVRIWASMPGVEEFLLAELEEVAPFADIHRRLPFLDKDCQLLTRSGKKITIKANPHFQVKMLSLSASSSCPYWQTLQEIKVDWLVGFAYYDEVYPSGSAYGEYFSASRRMRPPHCREAVALALNNAYLMSSQTYRDKLFSLQGLLYTDDAAQNIVDTRSLYYNNIMGNKTLWMGLTTKAGLGGGWVWNGSIWSFLESAFLTHYADDLGDPTHSVVWHEFGHILGYGHTGNMTFEKYGVGWSEMTTVMYFQLGAEKRLPVYSRRFMHTREKAASLLYENFGKVDEWHSFGTTEEDDPELYEIDKGQLWLF